MKSLSHYVGQWPHSHSSLWTLAQSPVLWYHRNCVHASQWVGTFVSWTWRRLTYSRVLTDPSWTDSGFHSSNQRCLNPAHKLFYLPFSASAFLVLLHTKISSSLPQLGSQSSHSHERERRREAVGIWVWDGEVEGEGCDLHQQLSAKNAGILLVLLLEDPVGITEFQVRDLEQRFRTFWDWSDQLIWTTQCAFSLYLFWDLFASSVWEESGV